MSSDIRSKKLSRLDKFIKNVLLKYTHNIQRLMHQHYIYSFRLCMEQISMLCGLNETSAYMFVICLIQGRFAFKIATFFSIGFHLHLFKLSFHDSVLIKDWNYCDVSVVFSLNLGCMHVLGCNVELLLCLPYTCLHISLSLSLSDNQRRVSLG